ncbi:hypothetical protein JHK82_057119 [Glycine max]|nr:hypothetical protein JHK87_057229 [Glycine soja]KAG5078424.1 hypothetical protein JHK82_057119 [Glycine max]
MRAEESWEASRYVHYAPAVVEQKGSACPLPVAMPSIATFPIDLLAFVPSPLKPVIALNAIFNAFSCNFPSVNPRILGLIIIFYLNFNQHTNSGVMFCGGWNRTVKPKLQTCYVCNRFCWLFHNGSCINAMSLGMCIFFSFLCVL